MALSKNVKQKILDGYGQDLATSQHAFVLEFKGVTVPTVTELRAKVRAAGGRYEVVKNTLARKASEGTAMAALAPHLKGPTAIVHTKDDPVALAKVLTEFVKDVPGISFKAGLIEGQPIAANQIADIATLPGRQELIAKLLFLVQSPISRFVRTLAAIPRDFVVVLDQVRQKKEGNA